MGALALRRKITCYVFSYLPSTLTLQRFDFPLLHDEWGSAIFVVCLGEFSFNVNEFYKCWN